MPPLSSLVALDVVKNVVSCTTCDNTVSLHDNSFRYCSRHFSAMVPCPARPPPRRMADTFMEIQVSSMYTLEPF